MTKQFAENCNGRVAPCHFHTNIFNAEKCMGIIIWSNKNRKEFLEYKICFEYLKFTSQNQFFCNANLMFDHTWLSFIIFLPIVTASFGNQSVVWKWDLMGLNWSLIQKLPSNNALSAKFFYVEHRAFLAQDYKTISLVLNLR